MPGPTYTRPPTPDTGEQTRRQALEGLITRRTTDLDANGHTQQANLARELSREFAEAVERANSSRALLRQQPIEYVDAVLLDGSAGQLVVDAVEYDAAPVYAQSRVGEVDRILHGADLDAYLRTGERRYAEAIGLR